MSRAPLRATLPGEKQPAAPAEGQRVYVDIVQPLLDDKGAGKLLGGISPAQVKKLRLHAGLPFVDLSVGDPMRRKKGLYAFDPAALRAWWQARQNGGGA